MILCHACGQLILPDQKQSGFEAARDHGLEEHLADMGSGDLIFSDVFQRPEALTNEPDTSFDLPLSTDAKGDS